MELFKKVSWISYSLFKFQHIINFIIFKSLSGCWLWQCWQAIDIWQLSVITAFNESSEIGQSPNMMSHWGSLLVYKSNWLLNKKTCSKHKLITIFSHNLFINFFFSVLLFSSCLHLPYVKPKKCNLNGSVQPISQLTLIRLLLTTEMVHKIGVIHLLLHIQRFVQKLALSDFCERNSYAAQLSRSHYILSLSLRN